LCAKDALHGDETKCGLFVCNITNGVRQCVRKVVSYWLD